MPICNPSTLDVEAGELRVKNATVKHLDILPTRLLACVMIFMLPNIVTWTLAFYGTLPQTTCSTAKLSRVGMKPRLAPPSQTSLPHCLCPLTWLHLMNRPPSTITVGWMVSSLTASVAVFHMDLTCHHGDCFQYLHLHCDTENMNIWFHHLPSHLLGPNS